MWGTGQFRIHLLLSLELYWTNWSTLEITNVRPYARFTKMRKWDLCLQRQFSKEIQWVFWFCFWTFKEISVKKSDMTEFTFGSDTYQLSWTVWGSHLSLKTLCFPRLWAQVPETTHCGLALPCLSFISCLYMTLGKFLSHQTLFPYLWHWYTHRSSLVSFSYKNELLP